MTKECTLISDQTETTMIQMPYALRQFNDPCAAYMETAHERAAIRRQQKAQMSDKEYRQDIYSRLDRAAGLVKLAMGISINAAWYNMQIALDSVKKHPRYRHEIKRAFALAEKAFEDFERTLRRGNMRTPLFFDMNYVHRECFKDDLTADEYYEFWRDLGAAGCDMSRNELNVLKHKYELTLEHNGCKYYDIGGELLLTTCLFRITQDMWKSMMKLMEECFPELRRHVISDYFFKAFDISHVADAWYKAVSLLYGGYFKCNDFDDKNIELAIKQVEEKWCDSAWMEKVQENAVRHYDDFIGSKKKVSNLIKEMRTSHEEGGLFAI